MNKKIGPLKTGQWLLIAGGAIVLYYLYTKYQAAAANSASTTPAAAVPSSGTSTDTTGTSSDQGPIDPTTGQPYAEENYGLLSSIASQLSGSNTTPNQNAGPTNLQQELSDLGSIESLFAGLPVPTSGGAQGTPATITVKIADQGKKAVKKAAGVVKKGAQGGRKTSTHPHGHKVTTHPGGKKTVASTAPVNRRQHQNVQPPNHMRANPTVHHTAAKPAPAPVRRPPARPKPAPKPKPAKRR